MGPIHLGPIWGPFHCLGPIWDPFGDPLALFWPIFLMRRYGYTPVPHASSSLGHRLAHLFGGGSLSVLERKMCLCVSELIGEVMDISLVGGELYEEITLCRVCSRDLCGCVSTVIDFTRLETQAARKSMLAF